jgi:hypothetical protein
MAGYYQCIYLILDSRGSEVSPRLKKFPVIGDEDNRTTALPYSTVLVLLRYKRYK